MPIIKEKPVAPSPALRLEKAVANCIIADQSRGPYPPRIEPYWKAFKSDFSPGAPFTLYCPFANTVYLYVYEKDYCVTCVPRDVFNPNCEIIASRLVNIAKAARRLGEKGYCEFDYRGIKKSALPSDFATNWRRYRGILPDAEVCIYLMSVDIMPLPKLYLM